MSILKNKEVNQQSKDPIDILIFDKGLRIRTLFIEKELDLLLVILNNGNLIKSRISMFNKLSDASQEELLKWELRNNGTGLRWDRLDEDLSLYGFIKEASRNSMIDLLMKSNSFVVIA
jgi:hypothetical protein